MIKYGWTFVALLLSALRVYGVMDNRFQAIAHLCVGGWFCAWIDRQDDRELRIWYGLLFLIPSSVELVCFLAGIGKIDGR